MPNVFATSGAIEIEYNLQELHDDSVAADDYTKSTFAAAGYSDASVNALNASAVLRFDGNGDGDLRDNNTYYLSSPDDYDLYNHIVMVDLYSGDIQFAYKLTEHSIYSNGDGDIDAGDVVTIKGDKYVVTDADTTDNDIELGPAITRTLYADAVDEDNAHMVSGTKKVLYGTDGYLYFYDGASLVESPVSLSGIASYPYMLTSTDIQSDEFKPYKIYVVSNTSTRAKVTFVEKSQRVKLTNDQDGARGYSSVKVGDTEWFTGGTTGIYFLSDPISLPKGMTIDLPDTYYSLKFTAAKQFDILRKKTSAVASGTKLKETTAPGKDFLISGASITVSVVGSDISIYFGSDELHDDYTPADDYTKATLATYYNDAAVHALNASAVLRFDGNADGDLKDQPYPYDDYDLYNHIVMIDMPNGDIQFAYKLNEHTIFSNNDGNIDAGDVVLIKGDKYVVVDNDTSDKDIELGPAITKSLTADTVDKDNAVIVSGTKKILYDTDGLLRFYDAGAQVESPLDTSTINTSLPYKLTPRDITSDEFKPYHIYVLYADGSTAKVAFVEKSRVVKLSNDEEGVMGYSSIKVGDTDWYNDGLYFLSDPISLPKGETIDLADTYYQLKYTSSKQFDILRKKVSAVVSGTKLKTTTAPGEDFLKESIIVTVIPIPTVPSCGYAVSSDMVLTSSLSGCSGSGLIMAANNIILDCAGYSIIGAPGTTGISISGKNNVTVKNCILKSFDKGIDISNSDNNTIINNIMTDSWGILGISLESSNYNTIANNSVSSKSTYGIVQYTSNYNLILNNTVTGSGDKGIYITGTPPGGWGSVPGPCSHSNISGNVVSNNGYGIYLDNEDNNLIIGNYLYANTIYGIYLNDSWLNSVYDNHLNNTDNAYDTGSLSGPNYWNASKRSGTNIVVGPYLGGNFWARPDGTGFSETCTDADYDGICDSVYTLTSANVDYLPLAFRYVDAAVDIDPDTLNLKSKGKWITAYIELPEGYDAADINVSTVLLGGTVPAKMRPLNIGDQDRDGISDLMVKFDRADVVDLIKTLNSDLPADVELTVAGSLTDGTQFEGSDTIRVIESGRMMRNQKNYGHMRGGGRRGGSGGMQGSGAGIAPVPVASSADGGGNYDSGNYDTTNVPDKSERKTKRKRMMWGRQQ